MTDRNVLKEWFSKGMKPLASQFAEWIDSYWHKEDKIPAGRIGGLQQALDGKADKDTMSTLVSYLQTTNYGEDLIFNPDYIEEASVKRLRKCTGILFFEFMLDVAASADMYSGQIVLCSNVPADELKIADERIPLLMNCLPADDAVSLSSSFTGSAYVYDGSIFCRILPGLVGAHVSQIVLTGAHPTGENPNKPIINPLKKANV
jgi:hypothetical protein